MTVGFVGGYQGVSTPLGTNLLRVPGGHSLRPNDAQFSCVAARRHHLGLAAREAMYCEYVAC